MNSQDLRVRADAYVAAWNRRDYGEVAAILSPDVVLVDHTRGLTVLGPEGYIDRFRGTMNGFPDMRGETISLLVEGNRIALETVWRGTNTAPLVLPTGETVAPTRRQATMHVAAFTEFDEEGRAKEIHTYSKPDILAQLGVTQLVTSGGG